MCRGGNSDGYRIGSYGRAHTASSAHRTVPLRPVAHEGLSTIGTFRQFPVRVRVRLDLHFAVQVSVLQSIIRVRVRVRVRAKVRVRVRCFVATGRYKELLCVRQHCRRRR